MCTTLKLSIMAIMLLLVVNIATAQWGKAPQCWKEIETILTVARIAALTSSALEVYNKHPAGWDSWSQNNSDCVKTLNNDPNLAAKVLINKLKPMTKERGSQRVLTGEIAKGEGATFAMNKERSSQRVLAASTSREKKGEVTPLGLFSVSSFLCLPKDSAELATKEEKELSK